MKFWTLILLGALVASIGNVACDFNSHTEPDLNFNKAEILGQEIYINKSLEKPTGIDSLYINEGDTLELKLTTRLLNAPAYTWKVNDNSILKILPVPDDPLSFYAVALADSGTTSMLSLDDPANSANRKLNVVITKHWADPDYYISLGTFGGHYYYLSRAEVTWPEANYNCEVAGGYLPCISSQEENAFLHEARTALDIGNAWIGIRYIPTDDGGFTLKKWVNGDDLTYEYFTGKGGPDGFRALYFFAMRTDRNGIWSNYPVAQRFNYFLEME